MELNKIYNQDCLEGLKQVPSTAVIITDPPYGINLDLKWLSEVNLAKSSPANICDEKLIGDEKPIDVSHLLAYPKRLIFGFPYIYDPNATGWIVWDKQPKVEERGIVTPVEVASTTLRKGYDIIRCMWGGYMRDSMLSEVRYEHPTQKPLKLMYRIIEKFTKPTDLIVDPYAGSGSTLIAASMLKRSFIGFEINPTYCQIAQKRLETQTKQIKLGFANKYASAN